jgi:hypothetical protein
MTLFELAGWMGLRVEVFEDYIDPIGGDVLYVVARASNRRLFSEAALTEWDDLGGES